MIVIAPPLLTRISALAEAAYPEEACGLITGRSEADGHVVATEIVPSANVADEKRRSFEIDPKVRFHVLRALSAGPERVVGHFHSHPDRPAVPSPADLNRAFEPDLIWVIISVQAGRAAEISAYRLEAAAAAVHEVAILPAPAMAPVAV